MLEEIDLVRIRLRRMGKKNAPFYRMVVADSTSPRDGRFIETLGHYNPSRNPHVLQLQEDRVLHWLSRGATPSETARSLLRREGILKRWHEMRHPASGDAAAGEAEGAEETAEA